MTKHKYITPERDNIPTVGTVFVFKGSRQTINTVFLVVANDPIISQCPRDGAYYFFGITCIRANELDDTNDPEEFQFHFPHSSMSMGKPMRPWRVIDTATRKIRKVTTTVYVGE